MGEPLNLERGARRRAGDASDHTCALDSGGSLWCWGYNLYGQLGINCTAQQNIPTAVRFGAGGRPGGRRVD